MLWRLAWSPWTFRMLLALPALAMLGQFLFAARSWSLLLDRSGEWAFRMLILALAVTPIRLILKQMNLGPKLPMWLFKHRRELGLAAFLYAALHLGAYLMRQSNLHTVLYDSQYKEYLAGWVAFALLAVLAVTSSNRAVHALGLWWKPLQRLAYAAIVTAGLHWMWIRLDDSALWLHILPLALLEAYRILYNFARPAGVRQ